MEKNMKNNELLEKLLQKYYGDNGKPLQYENPWRASHWEHLKDKFSIEKDENGNVAKMSGYGGFGNMLYKSHFLKYVFEFLLYCYWFIRLPYKKQIVYFYNKAKLISKQMEIFFVFENFRQVLTLSVIDSYLSKKIKNKPYNFLMIGDGYGFLSALAKKCFPDSRFFLVDLGETLAFQYFYIQKSFPGSKHIGIFGLETNEDLSEYDFIYCPTEYLETLSGLNFDICINTCSMQEMNIQSIERYFTFMRHNVSTENLFYCANREYKELRGGEVSEFDKYPWDKNDHFIFKDYCPWLNFSIQRMGAIQPKFLGIKIPFIEINPVKSKHALTVLASSN